MNKHTAYRIATGQLSTDAPEWWIVWDEQGRAVYAVETKATAYGLVRRAFKEAGYEWTVRLAPDCYVPDPTEVYVVNR